MAKNIEKDVETVSNTIVEVLVRKFMEKMQMIQQKDMDYYRIHLEAVQEIEKNIAKQYGIERPEIEVKTAEIKEPINEQKPPKTEEKTVVIPLDKQNESPKIENKYVEQFKDLTESQIDYKIFQKEKGREYFASSEHYNPEEVKKWDNTIEQMKEAKEILFNKDKVQERDVISEDGFYLYYQNEKADPQKINTVDELKSEVLKIATLERDSQFAGIDPEEVGSKETKDLVTKWGMKFERIVEGGLETCKEFINEHKIALSKVHPHELTDKDFAIDNSPKLLDVQSLGNEYFETFKEMSLKQIDSFIDRQLKLRDEFAKENNTKEDLQQLKKWDRSIVQMKDAREELSSRNPVETKVVNIQVHQEQKQVNEEMIPSHIRAQMESLNHLKSMSMEHVFEALKEAHKQANQTGKSMFEVYKDNLQKEVTQNMQIYKERTLSLAMDTRDKNTELRQELREIDTKITHNLGILYQAKIENKIDPEHYIQLKNMLNEQKEQIVNRLDKIERNENKINKHLKLDLQTQFPELKVKELTLNENIALASAAYSMTNEKTIENLKNFAKENSLSDTLEAIDKVTDEIEIEINEVTITRY